jgi:hypothetical protein
MTSTSSSSLPSTRLLQGGIVNHLQGTRALQHQLMRHLHHTHRQRSPLTVVHVPSATHAPTGPRVPVVSIATADLRTELNRHHDG